MAFKPHDLASLKTPMSTRRRVVEIISRPFPPGPEMVAIGSLCRFGAHHPDGLCECAAVRDPKYHESERIKVRMVPGEPTTLAEVATASSTLLPYPKKRYLHVARVTSGFSSFPEDMLRYDAAAFYRHDLPEAPKRTFPRSAEDLEVEALLKSPEGVLVYTLSDRKADPWTKARWDSFSALLKPVLIRDLRRVAVSDNSNPV